MTREEALAKAIKWAEDAEKVAEGYGELSMVLGASAVSQAYSAIAQLLPTPEERAQSSFLELVGTYSCPEGESDAWEGLAEVLREVDRISKENKAGSEEDAKPRNLALEYLQTLSDEESTLEHWTDHCMDFQEGFRTWAEEQGYSTDLLWVDPLKGVSLLPREAAYEGPSPIPAWRYHAAAVINGRVHCPWFPGLVRPPEDFAKAALWNVKSWELHPGQEEDNE